MSRLDNEKNPINIETAFMRIVGFVHFILDGILFQMLFRMLI